MKIISREPKIRKHIDPIVIDFLNKKGLLEIYESYLLSRIKQIIERWSSESLFEYPFTIMSISWSDTIEGSDFWCNIHEVVSKIDNYKKSLDSYKKVLDLIEDKKTKENYDFVEKKLKELENSHKEDNSSPQNNDKNQE